MLVLSQANLVFLAVPKTGSTAIEMALRPHADIAFMKGRKHMTAQRYRNKMAPFLHDVYQLSPETVAVMRTPVDQIRSWYKYRMRDERAGHVASTDGIDFEAFARAVIAPNPPAYAGIGSQYNFLTDGQGQLCVDHLFAYEALNDLRSFLEDRLGKALEFKRKNVSPDVPTDLSLATEAALRKARAAEFALHDRLLDQGGYIAARAT